MPRCVGLVAEDDRLAQVDADGHRIPGQAQDAAGYVAIKMAALEAPSQTGVFTVAIAARVSLQ